MIAMRKDRRNDDPLHVAVGRVRDAAFQENPAPLHERAAVIHSHLRAEVAGELEWEYDSLIAECESLQRHLAATVERLRHWNPDAEYLASYQCTPINSLGEIQGRGHEIDRHCARLDAAYQTFRKLVRLEQTNPKEAIR